MPNVDCKGDTHLGPFVWEADGEHQGNSYMYEWREYVTLTCEHCRQEIRRLSMGGVADLLNQICT
jgi:hypothetical protein